MGDFLSALNNTSDERLFWYTFAIIIILSVIYEAIVAIIKALKK